jgi:hypothetical protein
MMNLIKRSKLHTGGSRKWGFESWRFSRQLTEEQFVQTRVLWRPIPSPNTRTPAAHACGSRSSLDPLRIDDAVQGQVMEAAPGFDQQHMDLLSMVHLPLRGITLSGHFRKARRVVDASRCGHVSPPKRQRQSCSKWLMVLRGCYREKMIGMDPAYNLSYRDYYAVKNFFPDP